MNNFVMIDLETMATVPQSAIVSVGACTFSIEEPFPPKDYKEFYDELDWKNQNRIISKDCVNNFWKKQPKKVREALKGVKSLKQSLIDLAKWLPTNVVVFGNGSLFDIGILEDAYRQCELEIPWKFRNVLDCRTVSKIFNTRRGGIAVKFPETGIPHNALGDAKNQAKWVTEYWRRLINPPTLHKRFLLKSSEIENILDDVASEMIDVKDGFNMLKNLLTK